MKYLQDYIKEGTTALLNECSAFFAFSESQLEEGLAKQEDKDVSHYCSMSGGLICLKSKAKDWVVKFDKLVEEGIKQDIEENGKWNIIRRELNNHEVFYIGDIESTVDSLIDYGFTVEEINTVYRGRQFKEVTNDSI